MRKEEFLKELSGYLEILDDNEQKDILDEYGQHIELKMQNGMSEEEAIRDFGEIDRLAADILEAYHVRPSYREQAAHPSQNSLNHAASSVVNSLKKVWYALRGGIKAPFLWASNRWKAFLTHRKEKDSRPKKISGENGWKKTICSLPGKVLSFCITAAAAILHFAEWCFFFCLKTAAFCTGAFFAFLGLMLLLFLGTAAVLLFAGYPLIGVTTAAFGGVLILGTASLLLFGLVFKPQKNKMPLEVTSEDA